MAVVPVLFGHDEVEQQNVTDDRRHVGLLRNAHHQRLDTRQGLVVDEDGVR